MIASKVVVHSRRYDAAFDEMLALEFPKGLTLRPILSASDLGQHGYSSIVTCRLKQPLHNSVEVKSTIIGKQDLQVALGDYIPSIVAGLDVRVEFQQAGEGSWQTVHHPITSLRAPADIRKWLEKVAFVSYTNDGTQAIIETHYRRLRPVTYNDSIYGLAAISTSFNPSIRYLGTMTIGGLALPSHGPDSFIGYMDYQPSSAKRDASNKLSAPPEAIREWADEQIKILKEENIGDLEWCVVTTNLCDFDIDPTEIARIPFLRNGSLIILDLPGVIAMARETGIGILRSGFIDHVETHGKIDLDPNAKLLFNNLPVFRPIKNCSFLNLSIENNIPKNMNCFIGCVYRYALRLDFELKFKIQKAIGQSTYWPVDLMVISADAAAK